jgi:glucose-6-phosphate isomerase
MSAPLRDTPAWKALERHHAEIGDTHLRELFAEDPERGSRMTAAGAGLRLDYSKHRATDETLRLLIDLARERGVEERREAMFSGARINTTEGRAVLHVALRAPAGDSIVVDGSDVVPAVHEVLDRMAAFADRVRSGDWKGHTGKPIRNVINVGIGGSDLGPVMAYEALRSYSQRDLEFRFVSNVDGTDFVEATRDLDPAETLFIIASKTFTTQETMTNAASVRQWVSWIFHAIARPTVFCQVGGRKGLGPGPIATRRRMRPRRRAASGRIGGAPPGRGRGRAAGLGTDASRSAAPNCTGASPAYRSAASGRHR